MPEVRCPAAFMRFWDVYPRHDRKDDAIRQWNRAIDCGESAEEIILGAERYGEFARKNNQQSYRLFQAHNFIRGASYNESWGSSWTPRPKRSSSPLIHAHLIVTFKAEQPDWSFELWSNMHPDAAKIQCVSPGRFTLNDQVIYYDYQASIFKSYEECFDTHRDGTPYHGPYWWKTPEGKALMRQRRVLNPPLTGN